MRKKNTASLLFLLLFAQVTRIIAGQTGYFTEITEESGLAFKHVSGASGKFYLPEIMGPGAAFLDYDRDGDLDVYLVQGGALGPASRPGQSPSIDRLYRNDLVVDPSGSSKLHFADVTSASGIVGDGYGMGVASADFDNDGWPDLYVTNFGKNRLLRNKGDGRFEDVTDAAGVGDSRWSVSAAFLDFDQDGWLDLYVANYVQVDLDQHKPCRAPNSAMDYCTPLVYRAQADSLFRNRGDGSFEDVSRQAGIAGVSAPGLGVLTIDSNQDGRPDIYVANDAQPNQLWINQGDGRFVDDAFFRGAAVNMAGAAEGSMGVAAGDFDNDGDNDLFMTHLTGESNTLYVNDGAGLFDDRTISSGLGGPSKPYTGFGTGWIDVDNDGWLDVIVVNGGVSVVRTIADRNDISPLGQSNQLFHNQSGKGFRDISKQAGKGLSLAETSRGLAIGDVDNDGDSDILIANNQGPVRLFLNVHGNQAHWLGMLLRDQEGRDSLGVKVAVYLSDGTTLWRHSRTDGSYASANDPRVLIGLGTDSKPERISVFWLDGQVEDWSGLPENRYSIVKKGRGRQLTE